jgi:hypothetical protein
VSLIPLKLPPGQFLNGSAYQRGGRWGPANLVRWREGFAQPVGGWKKVAMTLAGSPLAALTGVARAMITWRDNSQGRWLGMGTEQKLYAYDGSSIFDITPAAFVTGNVNAQIGLGYGVSNFGSGTWGTVRTGAGIALEAAFWSFDNWGDQLVACANSDGRLFSWVPGAANALVITGAPKLCRGVLVTNERYLMALGAGDTTDYINYTSDPRNVAWCDQEDYNTWQPTLTNTAGSIRLDTQGIISSGLRFNGDPLIFTDQDVHRAQYLGPPYIYAFRRLATNCGLIGPNAKIMSSSLVMWMSKSGFFAYDGTVRPVDCDVLDKVLGDINVSQASKIAAGHNSLFNEFWWFYPTASATEPNAYVYYNYQAGYWGQGLLPRSAWAEATAWDKPLACNGGVLYQHEDGYDDAGAARTVYLESSPFEIGSGDQLQRVNRCIHDTDGVTGVCKLTMRTRLAPNDTETTWPTVNIDDSRGYTDLRAEGRQAVLRIEQISGQDKFWRIGDYRLDVVPTSGR